MNKTAQTEYYRLFLLEKLPEPLTPASTHVQIFDNYIENTRMRMRQVRDPYTNTWNRTLQQSFSVGESEDAVTKLAEIYLDGAEFEVFSKLDAPAAVRKNRYFHEFDNVAFFLDVYLGPLSGLVTARVDFPTARLVMEFIPPAFAIFDVTSDRFFIGKTLSEKTFDEVVQHIEGLTPLTELRRISAGI
ncbi:MAG: hypothetical protein ABR530_03070 [Pyrinomonadaceae bacterium]